MPHSSFDLFKIGVGPSSSHTMGPMIAAFRFGRELLAQEVLLRVVRVEAKLFGSLALTGKGHASDRAILLGLTGHLPAEIDPDVADVLIEKIRTEGQLFVQEIHRINFLEARDIIFLKQQRLPFHSNSMSFTAFDAEEVALMSRSYYSTGGGTVLDESEVSQSNRCVQDRKLPFPFQSGDELLALCRWSGASIAELMRQNEQSDLLPQEVSRRLRSIRDAMSQCIDRGVLTEGILPGGLNVRRRAPGIYRCLQARQERSLADPLSTIDWVNLWALAVNEENAGGGRVVTAPTNGAAGIIPAVLRYYERFSPGASDEGVETFLLTAAAIGSLFKDNASISGAEVGCQGEIGVACSMAAAGLTAALGGTPEQIENAAEIGMEHNLGLTCDPVGGLVQVPCIERNAVGAVKAIEATRLALLGDGSHRVSLDQVIETMRKTGLDMSEHYKETALGGLAVNVVEC